MKIIFTLLFAFLLTNCSGNNMKPIDFKGKEPRLIIEDYLSGSVKAWGILQNRSGKVIRQFSADLNGKWNGSELILDEKFDWSDGEVQKRQWKIKKIDGYHLYGSHYSNTLQKWRESFLSSWDMIARQGFNSSFKKMWDFYFSYCDAGFKSKNIDLIQFSLQNK